LIRFSTLQPHADLQNSSQQHGANNFLIAARQNCERKRGEKRSQLMRVSCVVTFRSFDCILSPDTALTKPTDSIVEMRVYIMNDMREAPQEFFVNPEELEVRAEAFQKPKPPTGQIKGQNYKTGRPAYGLLRPNFELNAFRLRMVRQTKS
jgi:hypothetical protein